MKQNNVLNIDVNQCPSEYCECGCPFFVERMVIRRVPALMAGGTSDQFLALKFHACEGCMKPHKDTRMVIPEDKRPTILGTFCKDPGFMDENKIYGPLKDKEDIN